MIVLPPTQRTSRPARRILASAALAPWPARQSPPAACRWSPGDRCCWNSRRWRRRGRLARRHRASEEPWLSAGSSWSGREGWERLLQRLFTASSTSEFGLRQRELWTQWRGDDEFGNQTQIKPQKKCSPVFKLYISNRVKHWVFPETKTITYKDKYNDTKYRDYVLFSSMIQTGSGHIVISGTV